MPSKEIYIKSTDSPIVVNLLDEYSIGYLIVAPLVSPVNHLYLSLAHTYAVKMKYDGNDIDGNFIYKRTSDFETHYLSLDEIKNFYLRPKNVHFYFKKTLTGSEVDIPLWTIKLVSN